MQRTIDFLNISSFMVEIERVKDPSLAKRPTVVAPLNSDSAKVWDASFEAKEAGIHKGMELAVARRLERGLKIISPNPDLYNSIHKKLLFEASRMTPLYEPSSLGKIYLDFTGFEKLYGRPWNFAQKIQEKISGNYRLRPRLGIAENKLMAKAAANPHQAPQDIFWVNNKAAQSFLNPFPNSALPIIKEIKKSAFFLDVFEDLNLLTVQDLKALDLVTLKAIFAQKAELIFQMARGIDYRPVLPPRNEPLIAVDIHLEETNSLTRLLQALRGLADQAFSKLRAKSLCAGRLKVALRYADYKYLEKIVPLQGQKQYAHEIAAELERSIGFLFSRRTSVRYLFLELGELSKREIQLNFLDDPKKPLMEAMDKIEKKFPKKLKMGRELL